MILLVFTVICDTTIILLFYKYTQVHAGRPGGSVGNLETF